MYSDTLINKLKTGDQLTIQELETELINIERQAFEKGNNSAFEFMADVRRRSRAAHHVALEKNLHVIMEDLSDFCYDMRRIKNGQDISSNPASGAGTVPKE